MKRVLPLALFVLGCSPKEERFESVVQVVSRTVVEHEEGKASQVDFELEWDPCPGDQFQVIRGGKEFAECTANYKSGTYLPVVVKHYWDPHGYYRWDIEKLGECERPIEQNSPGSYEKGQECHEVSHFGHKAGFECSRKPFKNLVARCPWMARE